MNYFLSDRNYWFKPKRFWKYFAAYYPVSWQGWLTVLIALWILVKLFLAIDRTSSSGSDTLFSFTPYAIAVLGVLDIITLHTGEYPQWWRHWRK